jgi:hypothetical protein
MKRCPYCAEEVQDRALVCKYCRRQIASLWPRRIAFITITFIIAVLLLKNKKELKKISYRLEPVIAEFGELWHSFKAMFKEAEKGAVSLDKYTANKRKPKISDKVSFPY